MNAIDKIVSLEYLQGYIARAGPACRPLVLTNGCFDLLHLGHIRYLEQARSLGSLMVVGINADEAVKRLKGPGHPLVPAEERAELVAALASVDFVTIFEELIASSLIQALYPDIYCKGGDYGDGKPLPEADVVRSYGGQVRILPYLSGHSTSRLIIRTRQDGGIPGSGKGAPWLSS